MLFYDTIYLYFILFNLEFGDMLSLIKLSLNEKTYISWDIEHVVL